MNRKRKHFYLLIGFINVLFWFCDKAVPTKGGEKRGNEYIKWLRKTDLEVISYAGISDINGDGVPEVIVYGISGDDVITYFIDGQDGSIYTILKRVVDKGYPEAGYSSYDFSSALLTVIKPHPPFIDINGDGIDESFTIDSYYINVTDLNTAYQGLATTVLSMGKEIIWSIKIDSPVSLKNIIFPEALWSIPVGVSRGNGTDILFSSSVIPGLYCLHNGWDGMVKWCREIYGGDTDFISADVNRDGKEDIIVFNKERIYDNQGKLLANPEISVLNGIDGEKLWGKEIDCKSINASGGDVDGDGNLEIVISCSVPSLLKILNADNGDEKYSFNIKMERGDNEIEVITDEIETSISPVLGRLGDNMDGRNDINDIVVEKHELAMEDTNGNGIFGDCVDLNNNGKYEKEECDILIGGSYCVALDIQKGILWKYKNFPDVRNGRNITFLIGDADGDGQNEVISNYTDGEDFELQIINGEDGIPEFWYGDFRDYAGYTFITNVRLWGLEDVDRDGMLELLVTGRGCITENNCNPVIMLLSTESPFPADASLLPWSLPRRDKFQSNRL